MVKKMNMHDEDKVLKSAAELLREIAVEEQEKYFEKANHIDEEYPIHLDKEFLKTAMEYDEKQRKKKKMYSALSKVAIILLGLVLSFEIVLPEKASAFHAKVFELIFNDMAGSVSLNNENEYDLIGNWSDYYYPDYMSDGYVLTAAEKQEFESVLLYENAENNTTIRIMDQPLDFSFNVDTDSTEMSNVKVGIYDGNLFVGIDYDGLLLTWVQDNSRIIITTTKDLSKEEIVRIGENLKYIK